MYFKRWGLLAPPPGKVSLPKNLPAPLFPCWYYSTTIRGVQHAAFGRAGVQETVPLFHYTKISPQINIIHRLLGMCQKGAILPDSVHHVQAQNCQVDLTHTLHRIQKQARVLLILYVT
jgi:hypothetical protein